MKIQHILLAIVVVLIVGAIFYLQQPALTTQTQEVLEQTGPLSNEIIPIQVGELAPDFLLLDYEGKQHTLSHYKGKNIIVNFWASWCPFCLDEMPLFQEYYEKYKDEDFEIVAINRGETDENAKQYSDNLNLTYPILLNPRDDVARHYQLRTMPSTYFIDKEGRLVDIKLGEIHEEELVEKLDMLFGLTENDDEEEEESEDSSGREITITDGVKHSVPLKDIRGGGPAKDGIPSLDNPKFNTVDKANDYLDDEGLGISIMFNNIDRFYPFQILVWHEIINDQLGTQPALITYCPLCGTGIVFDPIVNGERSEFGTSGKLWNSNLVMYDRQTDSYWSQALGEAIVGEMTGSELNIIPYDVMTYKDWKAENPKGEVLSKDTGHFRNYSESPYGDYSTNDDIYFTLDNTDDRYHAKEPTFGIKINDVNKAYPQSELEKAESPFTDTLNGVELKITYNKDNKTISIQRMDTFESVIPSYGFWFSWIAIHAESEVFVSSN